jgi:hypothetical protein
MHDVAVLYPSSSGDISPRTVTREIEGTGASAVTTTFQPLIDILASLHLSGIEKPARHSVNKRLQKQMHLVDRDAPGVEIGQYCVMAGKAGVVQTGKRENGKRWIALDPQWRP